MNAKTKATARTPQQKKRLSYLKDRRNVYGENSKASRKGIPLAKARANRVERHAQDQALAKSIVANSDDGLVAVEAKVRGTKPRKWKKDPDLPLGKYLVRRVRRKSARAA